MTSRTLPVALLTLVAALAPTPSNASVSIGNPDLTAQPAGADGIVFDSFEISGAFIEALACDSVELNGGGSIELTGITRIIPMTACKIGVVFDGTLVIDGHGTSGGTFTATISLTEIMPALSTGYPLGQEDPPPAFVLEIGQTDWMTATSLGLASGTHVDIDDSDAVYDDIVAAIIDDSRIYLDSNGNGVIDGSERSAGPL